MTNSQEDVGLSFVGCAEEIGSFFFLPIEKNLKKFFSKKKKERSWITYRRFLSLQQVHKKQEKGFKCNFSSLFSFIFF